MIDSPSREIGRTPPDAIIAFGQLAATIGHELATALELPLIVECWQSDHCRRPPLRPHMVSAFATSSSGLAAAMGTQSTSSRGNHTSSDRCSRDVREQDGSPPSIAIIDAESDIGSTKLILESLAQVIRSIPDLQIFIELGTSKSNVLWRHAESLDLLERMSSFSNASQLRSLLGECTLMVVANSTCCTRASSTKRCPEAALCFGRIIPCSPIRNDSINVF